MFEKEKEEKGAKNLGVVFHMLITSAKKRILALEEELMRQRTMFTNQTMITAVIEAQFRQKIHRLDLWVRMMALSGSQRLIDHLRPMFPDSWIPGHTTISKAKVQCKTKQNKTKQNKTKCNNNNWTKQQKELLSKIGNELPIQSLPNGHGVEALKILPYAANLILANNGSFPQKILFLVSADAKSDIGEKFTEASVRWVQIKKKRQTRQTRKTRKKNSFM